MTNLNIIRFEMFQSNGTSNFAYQVCKEGYECSQNETSVSFKEVESSASAIGVSQSGVCQIGRLLAMGQPIEFQQDQAGAGRCFLALLVPGYNAEHIRII